MNTYISSYFSGIVASKSWIAMFVALAKLHCLNFIATLALTVVDKEHQAEIILWFVASRAAWHCEWKTSNLLDLVYTNCWKY